MLLWAEDYMKWLFLVPALVLMLMFTVFPLVYAFRISFFSFAAGESTFVGLDNYLSLHQDSTLINSTFVTLKFLAAAVTIEFLLGFAIAVLLNKRLKFRGTIQTIILIPMLVSGTVIGLLWRLIYSSSGGLLPYATQQILGRDVQYLADPTLAFLSVVIADVWQWTPLVVMIMLAGLQSIPDDLYEAAMMDGASRVDIATDIVLPYLKQLIFLVLILRIMGGVKIFAKIFILTRGGPAEATNVISLEMYRRAFRYGNYGEVSAIAVLLLVLVITASVLFMKVADIKF